MNILLLSSRSKIKHDILKKYLLHVFKNHDISVFESKFYATIDLIVVLNNELLDEARAISKKDGVPIIYCFLYSDIFEEFVKGLESIYLVLIFEDIKMDGYLPPLSNYHILPLLNVDNGTQQKESRDVIQSVKPLVYLHFDSDFFGEYLLLKLIGFLNSFVEVNFVVYAIGGIINFLNENIIVIGEDEKQHYFNKADVIIGSGYIIQWGLLNNKNCIVVGGRGYGGVVRLSNLEFFTKNSYQGRNGGAIGEYIPVTLLIKDIQEISVSKSEKQLIKEAFLDTISIVEKQILELVLNAKYPKISLEDAYRLNLIFEIEKKGDQHYVLKNCFSNHVVAEFSQVEILIIERISKSKNLSEILIDMKPDNKDVLIEFVTELIEMNILTKDHENKFK